MRDFLLCFMFVSSVFCVVKILKKLNKMGTAPAIVVAIIVCPVLLIVLQTFVSFASVFLLRGPLLDSLSSDAIYDGSLFLIGLAALITGLRIKSTQKQESGHCHSSQCSCEESE